MAEQARTPGVLLVAALCAGLLSLTHGITAGRIAANEARAANATAYRLLGEAPRAELPGVWRDDVRALCDGRVLVRRRIAGYAGPISLLLAVRTGQTPQLLGLAAVSHLETPGIADFLSRPEGGWLAGLRGHHADLTAVDTVSGATISSRAVLQAARAVLDDAAVLGAECGP